MRRRDFVKSADYVPHELTFSKVGYETGKVDLSPQSIPELSIYQRLLEKGLVIA